MVILLKKVLDAIQFKVYSESINSSQQETHLLLLLKILFSSNEQFVVLHTLSVWIYQPVEEQLLH